MESDHKMEFRRKYIRRPADEYRGRKRVFLTFCCDHRRPYFSQAIAARWILGRFREIASAHASLAHAWCAMPDHLHVFIEGTSDSSDALQFASDFNNARDTSGAPERKADCGNRDSTITLCGLQTPPIELSFTSGQTRFERDSAWISVTTRIAGPRQCRSGSSRLKRPHGSRHSEKQLPRQPLPV
jgi:hypothetical protein